MCIGENQAGSAKVGETLKYSPLTSCLTVTYICEDKTVVGGHFVMEPLKINKTVGEIAKLLDEKKVKLLYIVAVSTWLNEESMHQLYKDNEGQLVLVMNQKEGNLEDKYKAGFKAFFELECPAKFQRVNGEANNVSFTPQENGNVLLTIDGKERTLKL